jgi:hypothetical protein
MLDLEIVHCPPKTDFFCFTLPKQQSVFRARFLSSTNQTILLSKQDGNDAKVEDERTTILCIFQLQCREVERAHGAAR